MMKQKQKIISKVLLSSTLVYILIVLLDQFTKYLIRSNMFEGSSYIISDFLSLTFVKNTGVSFGMLQGFNWIFTFVSMIALILFGYFFWKAPDIRLAIAMSGITGNLIDRLFLGYVVDFINFHFWPIFNVADSAISIGLVLLILKKDK